jgi:hypothetical protein
LNGNLTGFFRTSIEGWSRVGLRGGDPMTG